MDLNGFGAQYGLYFLVNINLLSNPGEIWHFVKEVWLFQQVTRVLS